MMMKLFKAIIGDEDLSNNDISLSSLAVLQGQTIIDVFRLARETEKTSYDTQFPAQYTLKISQFVEMDNANELDTRQEAFQRCIQHLIHACHCHVATCERSTCSKMKKLVQHMRLCKKRTITNCYVCNQIMRLLYLHAEECTVTHCSVPFCLEIRRKVVEERRRQAEERLRRRIAVFGYPAAEGA
uniref:histone acetyltransferase n=1 Tax=Panagrellus redivivus TaxID=6233 RepID=A0A7E4UZ25_PANRE